MGNRHTREALEERIRILEEEIERVRLDKQTQKDLQFRNMLLATQMETSLDGILVVDENDRILSYNQRFIDLWNLPKNLIEDKIDTPVLQFVAAQMADPKTFFSRAQYLYHRREETSRDVLHLADGRAYDRYSAPLVGSDGHYYGRIWYFRDITDQNKAHVEKEKLRDQLNLAQKMESVGRLAGGVAHDFNNMLGVILGHAELALMSMDSSHPLYTDLEEIRKAAQRSADITRQLLIFARKQTVSPRVLDLNKTVEGMLKILRRLIGEDVTLVWKPGERLFPIKIDPSQIDQILANLCVNARDAITGVGTVTIETQSLSFDESNRLDIADAAPGDYAVLSVRDTGCGMSREALKRLFEPFFTTKEAGKGTGLGLATVYGIVKQNNGFIRVESVEGKGASFHIYIPGYLEKKEPAPDPSHSAFSMRGNETILLVEDEPAILNMTRLMLERFGYRVLAASKPRDALRLAKNHPEEIHLLITDVIMPDLSGQDLAKQLTSLYPKIKRLFTSGYESEVIAAHGVLDEGVHFIQKPFSMPLLMDKVREALEGKKAGSGA